MRATVSQRRPPGRPVRRSLRTPGRPPRPAAGDRRATRLELDDLALRVGDPLVVHPEELGDECLADPLDVAQGQVALVELAVVQALLDDPADHRPDRRLVARCERSDGRLDAVGEHDQGRLAALRLRSGMAVAPLVDAVGRLLAVGRRQAAVRRGRLLTRLGVEVADERRPVVLRDERDERLGQARPVGDVDPVGDVALEDLGRRLRVELVVDVVAAGLVLDVRERVGQLADVVVVGGDAGEQRVGADRLGGPLGQVGDHDRVVVGAGRLDQQAAQQRLRRVRQLEQLEHRQDPEHVAEHREGARPRRPRHRPRRRPRRPTAGCTPVRSRCAEEPERRHDEGVDEGDRDPGLDERVEPIAPPDRRRCRPRHRRRRRRSSRASCR